MEFDWDPDQAETNRRKHKIEFVTATRLFLDPWRIEDEQEDDDDGIRFNVRQNEMSDDAITKAKAVRFTLDPANPPKADWTEVDKLTEEEIHAAALSDPDAQSPGARAIGKYKVGKHFIWKIDDNEFTFEIDDKKVAEEAAPDGIYVIRTSIAKAEMTAEAAVLGYKKLAETETAFRTLKGVDLHVRPIRHRLESRVKAHIFLSVLAYYVQWHMIQASMRSMAPP